MFHKLAELKIYNDEMICFILGPTTPINYFSS